jgi:adenylate cyclase
MRTFSSELGGKRQPITVLFTDVAGFTPIAEGLDPEEVMAKTSRYFSDVGREMVRSGATIDKYIGDSIMAFWNAPEPREDHISAACLGALRAARRLDRLNQEFLAEGGSPMPTRFGLHTGEAIIGNVGSVDRINYTALGHTVNMASRIEKLSKRYGTTILVSEAVRDGVGDGYVFRFVDKTTPEGAHREMAIYELLGANRPDEPELEPFPERLRTLRAWEEAYSSYATEDWPIRAISFSSCTSTGAMLNLNRPASHEPGPAKPIRSVTILRPVACPPRPKPTPTSIPITAAPSQGRRAMPRPRGPSERMCA